MDVGIYKFLYQIHASKMLSGSLLFRRPIWFALNELCTGDKSVGDFKDGLTETVVERAIIDNSVEGEKLRQALNRTGEVRIDAGPQVELSQFSMPRRFQGFVMCMAAGDFEELTSELIYKDETEFSYDGCVEILDIDALCEKIRKASYRGHILSDIFTVKVADVEYREIIPTDFAKELKINTDAVNKGIDYKIQSEIRIILHPINKISDEFPETMIITIDDAGNIYEQRTLKNHAELPPSESALDLVSKINSLVWTGALESIGNVTERNASYFKYKGDIFKLYWRLRNLSPDRIDKNIDNFIEYGGPPTWDGLQARFLSYLQRLPEAADLELPTLQNVISKRFK